MVRISWFKFHFDLPSRKTDSFKKAKKKDFYIMKFLFRICLTYLVSSVQYKVDNKPNLINYGEAGEIYSLLMSSIKIESPKNDHTQLMILYDCLYRTIIRNRIINRKYLAHVVISNMAVVGSSHNKKF